MPSLTRICGAFYKRLKGLPDFNCENCEISLRCGAAPNSECVWREAQLEKLERDGRTLRPISLQGYRYRPTY